MEGQTPFLFAGLLSDFTGRAVNKQLNMSANCYQKE